MVEAEKAARTGKKPKKKKGGKGKKKKGKDKKGKKKKDPTAERSVESLYAELVSSGLVYQPPKQSLEDYVGGFNFLGATLDKAGLKPDPSMAQVGRRLAVLILRQGIAAQGIMLDGTAWVVRWLWAIGYCGCWEQPWGKWIICKGVLDSQLTSRFFYSRVMYCTLETAAGREGYLQLAIFSVARFGELRANGSVTCNTNHPQHLQHTK